MKTALVAVILILGSLLAGCCGNLIETPKERERRICLQTELQFKMLVDDWDYLWLQERASRLTQWHPYVGY